MIQQSHAWVAIRAVDLLARDEKTAGLAELLKPHLHRAAVGSWIPDNQDAKSGSFGIGYHIFKLAPYTKPEQQERFVMDRDTTFKKLGPARRTKKLIADWGDSVLNAAWWDTAYRAVNPSVKKSSKNRFRLGGRHLGNRAQAAATTLLDLLVFGNQAVAKEHPKKIDFVGQLSAEKERMRREQVALWAFCLSHFIADASVPVHCDARALASGKLHKHLEQRWVDKYTSAFTKNHFESGGFNKNKELTKSKANQVLQQARAVDATVGVSFLGGNDKVTIPSLVEKDAWYEIVNICRASFAVCCIIAPPDEDPAKGFPYDGKDKPGLKSLLADDADLMLDIDKAVLHDAVLTTAMVWKHIWLRLPKD